MKRLARLFLMLGILAGMFMQTAAQAEAPVPAAAASQSMGMDANCLAMMRHAPDKPPCDHHTQDCVSTAGCVVPLGLPGVDDAALAIRPDASPFYWPATRPLVGEKPAPEQHPPPLLG